MTACSVPSPLPKALELSSFIGQKGRSESQVHVPAPPHTPRWAENVSAPDSSFRKAVWAGHTGGAQETRTHIAAAWPNLHTVNHTSHPLTSTPVQTCTAFFPVDEGPGLLSLLTDSSTLPRQACAVFGPVLQVHILRLSKTG